MCFETDASKVANILIDSNEVKEAYLVKSCTSQTA